MRGSNPVIYGDYPDPDVIRVGDTYYMITTTMHMFPGAQILRSYDLINWEPFSYVYQTLGDHSAQTLREGNIYGQGMWAATLRYYNGVFHVLFSCKDTGLTYHFTATDAQGPWTRHTVQGFYHDASVLFDDDGRVYIVHGNRRIYITELTMDLAEPKQGGIDREVVCDSDDMALGYEGAHLHKINGAYYLFLIHWAKGKPRTQACFRADHIDGEFVGGDILQDDMAFHGMGVAQGGAIDTPDGKWFLMLFQDRGAAGRMPVLVPFVWETGFPKVTAAVQYVENESTHPDHLYMPLYESDTFQNDHISTLWQWNHEPDPKNWRLTPAGLRLSAGLLVKSLEDAPNTLTQRAMGMRCDAEVTLDASMLNMGDYAGICALQGCYAQLAVTRDDEGFHVCYLSRQTERTSRGMAASSEPVHERARVRLDSATIQLKMCFDFENMADTVMFYYYLHNEWQPIGHAHRLVYRLDHFMGCRIGLHCYATTRTGGYAVFKDFCYHVQNETVV